MEREKEKEESGLNSSPYAVTFTLGKNISQSQHDHPERKSSVGDN